MLSKKGEASYMGGKTSDILIALASLIVLGGVLFLFFGGDFVTELVCKISVNTADQFNKIPGFSFPVLCRTLDKVVEVNSVEDVKWSIAENMRKCWSMWGEGDLNAEGKNIFLDDELKCFKCYRLGFPEFETGLSAANMTEFLENPDNNVKGYNGNFVSYFDNNVIFNFRDREHLNNMIRKDEKYAITFVEHIEKDRWGRAGAAAGAGAAVGIGACIAMPGVGWIALPLCAGTGGVIGLGSAGAEFGIDRFVEWIGGERERDAIMFSSYGDVENYCGGLIE